jgi:hypothetical protein
MLKKIVISAAAMLLISGCSSKDPSASKFSVTEPTDYAMSCDSLLNEIKAIDAKLNNDDNLLESFVPDYLLNKETLTENDVLVLRERKKSLQLIYTLKEAKHECRTLTVDDTRDKTKLGKTAEQIKTTVDEVTQTVK